MPLFMKLIQISSKYTFSFKGLQHFKLKKIARIHGGLSQWGRSNRPRIRPGTVKSLNAPWELS